MIGRTNRYISRITFVGCILAIARTGLAQCEVDKMTAGDGAAGDRFGIAVAISGDCAVVGAYEHGSTGAAYVFERDGPDWVEVTKLEPPSGTLGWDDYYGRAVAVSGDVAVVGARRHDVFIGLPLVDAGAAYVFRRDATGTWLYEQKLFAFDAAAGDEFGYAVATDGNRIVVGAPDDDGRYSAISNSGTAYVFKHDGVDAWDFEKKLGASDAGVEDNFGRAVAISGEWIVIGGELANPDWVTDAGAAYVFRRHDVLLWIQEAKLTAQDDSGQSDTQTSAKFGNAVSIDGDRLIVAARTNDGAGASSGAAYVFRLDEEDWTIERKLTASDASGGAQFGRSVSIREDLILIGARDTNPGGIQAGSAYLFRRSGFAWTEVAKLVAGDPAERDFFGDSSSLGGDYAVVGAFKDDDNGIDSGSAYVFRVTLGEDCNNSGVADECDILAGASEDTNGNGVPDDCECSTDVDCGDGLACTIDTCDLAVERCAYEVITGFCAIGGVCYTDGEEHPINECEICDAAANPDDWTAKPYGSPCTPDDLECTNDVCDPASASCAHVLVPEFCAIGGSCYVEGSTNPDAECEICNPALVPDNWSLKPDGTPCTDDGLFCTGAEVCSGGLCHSRGDPCVDQALLCDEIGEACVECLSEADCLDGNDCTRDVCDAGTCANPDSPVGTPCGDSSDTDCTAPDTCDGGGVCLVNHVADETACTDDGAFCTGQERCLDGVCRSRGNPCFDLGLACKEETDECLPDCNGNDISDDQDIADGTSDDCNANGVPDECEIPGTVNATIFATGIDTPEEIKPSQGDYPPGFFVGGYFSGEPGVYHIPPEGGEATRFSVYERFVAAVLFVPDEFGGAGTRLFAGGQWARVYEIGTDGSVSTFFATEGQSSFPTGIAYVPFSLVGPLAGKLVVTYGTATYAVGSDSSSTQVTTLPEQVFSITLAPSEFGELGSHLFLAAGRSQNLYELDLQSLELNLFAVVPEVFRYSALRQIAFSPIGWAASLDTDLASESVMLVSAGAQFGSEGYITVWDQRGQLVAFMTTGPGGVRFNPRGMTFVGDDLFISNLRGGTVLRATVDDLYVDCNMNGLLDECELPDCNGNEVPDDCEPDCNDNGIADACDIADGTSVDDDANGVPDECELLYVDASATGGIDGSSWQNAFMYLQRALQVAAEVDSEVKEIWVAAGTYTPDRGGGWTAGNRNAHFQLLNRVGLYGGFEGADSVVHPGGETSRDQRDPTVNVTILSGDLEENDGPNFVRMGENSYHVVSGIECGPTAVLDGFTITGGNANYESDPPLQEGHSGGGMYVVRGSPTLANCTFVGNSASGHGGGMFNSDRSHPTLTNCTFTRNRAKGFDWVDGLGGGMANYPDSSPALTNCAFHNNSAGSSGGGMSSHGGRPILNNCVFIGNVATADGGGMVNQNSSPTLTNCMFLGNSGSRRGGGMCNRHLGNATVINSTFVGNSAPSGRAVANGTTPLHPGSINMSNCILWDGGDEIWNQPGWTITVTYSDVLGGWPGLNNIDEDPLFADAVGPDGTPGTDDADLRLSAGSPCIDAGDNEVVPVGITTDLEGNPRFIDDPTVSPDPGHGTPPIVDLGAYEYRPLLVVSLDVFPGVCPNRLSARKKGVLRMALVGGESFDVTTVDLDAVVLTRADGVGGAVRPLTAPAGLAPKLIDVATPFEGELCDCHDSRGDGTTDLLLRFSGGKMLRALQLESVSAGDFVTLTLRGRLHGGAQFEAADCVLMGGPPPRPDPPGPRRKARFR